jgi:putative PIN family toxin of toxin-antitoxin system
MLSNSPFVVLDTNVLLVALPTRSPYRPIFDQMLVGTFQLVISNEILTEYEEQIAKRYDPETVDEMLGMLGALPNVHLITPYFHWQLIVGDQDDDKFADAAIAANATYLVTNDRHFDVLKTIDFPKVITCTAQEFLRMLLPT